MLMTTTGSADWQALKAAIDGTLVLADSPEYERVRKPRMVRFQELRPQAIVLCASADDVAATIAFARRHGLEKAIRSGGHSVAGRSSTEGLVIDVSPMGEMSLAGGVATVGAGVRLGALEDVMAPSGRTIPSGSSHTVGIAGLTLGGGLGILGRTHGLTSDHLLRARVVLGDGRVVDCDEHHDSDLFWALRGAGGGNFGVVTSFVFRMVPVAETTVFHLVWASRHAVDLIAAWQAWAPDAPDALDATLRLNLRANREEPLICDVFGAVVAPDVDAAEFLDDLVARANAEPASETFNRLPYHEAKRFLDDLPPIDAASSGAPAISEHLFTKSEFFRRALPVETITVLVQNLLEGFTGHGSREIAFLPWGGAYNRVAADATAFAHRNERFLVQHLASIDATAARANADRSARTWVQSSWALLHPWGSGGVYPNFPDPELDDPRAYYGANYGRLKRIKTTYDPYGVFLFN
jgi:FAD/FMN-containing dehydrogenase